MSEKELNEYLNASLEVRYSIHKDYYFKEYPESNIEKFHKFEAAFLQREISKYSTKEKVRPKETEIYLSQIEVLEYINSLSSTLPPQQAEKKTDKLKVPQIALIHFYEGIQITKENAGEIAAKHGYTAKNSGQGLFQDYTFYRSTANRKGKPILSTPKKLKNKIQLFESVLNHLSNNNKQRVIDEINILKTILENEYQ